MTPRTSSSPTALSERVAEAKAANTGTALVAVTPRQRIEKNRLQIEALIPRTTGMSVDHFLEVVYSELRRTPKLAECTPGSVLGAVFTLAQIGLEPGPLGLAYLEPRRNHGVMEARPGIMYRGFLELASRSGRLASIVAQTVHKNDRFKYNLGTAEVWHDFDLEEDRGPSIGYYARATFSVNGLPGGAALKVMGKSEVKRYREFSQSFKRGAGPWVDEDSVQFDAQALKTVLLRLEPFLPKSSELAYAVAADSRTVVVSEDGKDVDIQGDDFGTDDDIADGEIIGTPEGAADEATNAAAEQEALDGFDGGEF
jgi:recombination protein RecT